MAVASHAIVFPTTGWESDLSCLLHLNEDRLVEFYRSKSTTERSYDRSYNFSVESYLVASTVKTKSSMQRMPTRDANNAFAQGLSLTPGQPYKETKYGLAPASSPLSYQQVLLPHGLSAQLSGIESVSFASTQLVPTPGLFKDTEPWLPAAHPTNSEILEKVRTTLESSLALERDTRQQSHSTTWQQERALRLTASNFG
ncbi:hypothetical protein MRX96_058480 [Rhipicephalus microplus]